MILVQKQMRITSISAAVNTGIGSEQLKEQIKWEEMIVTSSSCNQTSSCDVSASHGNIPKAEVDFMRV